MGFYHDCIVPHLVNLSMRNHRLLPYRERVLSAAEGRVLEVGIGSGLNVPFYPSGTREVIGLEPASRLLAMARRSVGEVAIPITLLEGTAEAIPLDDASVDTVVTTWTLCTIPEAVRAVTEMRRVLRPGGQLLFVEHGRSLEDTVCKWQDRLNPIWKRISGGCEINRPIRTLIERGGFAIDRIETAYAEGPKIMAFFYEGRAVPA